MYPFRSFQCRFNWVHWDVIVWVAAITFSLSAVIWAACQFDFTCVPVDVDVVLHEPGVSQDDCLMADAQDIEFGPALVTLVLDNEINRFSDLSDLIWWSICIIQPNWTWGLIGPKLICSDKLMVNKFSCCAAVYQCFLLKDLDTRNYDKLTGHLNPVKILNLQRYLQLANILYN